MQLTDEPKLKKNRHPVIVLLNILIASLAKNGVTGTFKGKSE
jgi:hypothetical protein